MKRKKEKREEKEKALKKRKLLSHLKSVKLE